MRYEQQEKIRRRAYEIWDAEGRVDGCQEDHWRRAEAEVEAEVQPPERHSHERSHRGKGPQEAEATATNED